MVVGEPARDDGAAADESMTVARKLHAFLDAAEACRVP
jgi:hypothetical protein